MQVEVDAGLGRKAKKVSQTGDRAGGAGANSGKGLGCAKFESQSEEMVGQSQRLSRFSVLHQAFPGALTSVEAKEARGPEGNLKQPCHVRPHYHGRSHVALNMWQVW